MNAAQALGLFEDNQAHDDDPKEGSDGDQVFGDVADPGKDNGHPQDHDSPPGAHQLEAAESQHLEVARPQSQEDSHSHGDGDIDEVPEETGIDPLVERQDLGEDEDGVDIVQGGAGQDKGGDAFFGAPAQVHEMDHHGDDHRR